ncbi:MAG: hypothetical protein ACE5EX_06380 [Phycisphaerae bacterium]
MAHTPTEQPCPTVPVRDHRWPVAIAILLAALAVRLPWMASIGFAIDQTQFVAWSEISRSGSELNPPGGLSQVYDRPPDGGRRWCNYPPVYIYVLRGLAGVYDRLAPEGRALNASVVYALRQGAASPETRLAAALYKAPAILADGLTGVLLFLFLARRHPRARSAAVAMVYVLLPAVIHNSTLWGQVDAVPTLLIVLSLEWTRRGRTPWMIAVATLAILTKAQAVMMTPLWLAEAVRYASLGRGRTPLRDAGKQADHPPPFHEKNEPRTSVPTAVRGRPASNIKIGHGVSRSVAMVAIATAVILAVLLPFHTALDGVWEAYTGAARYYPFTHLNGFSAWFLGRPMIEPHLDASPLSAWYASDASPAFLGLTPRAWGLAGLMVVWICTGLVLWNRRCDEAAIKLAARILPLAFFILSTQMHERYLFPAIAIWAWSFQEGRRWWFCWIVIAACATVNVFWAWPGPSEAAWITSVERLVHRSWMGLAPGIWCSLSLIGVFVLTCLNCHGHGPSPSG